MRPDTHIVITDSGLGGLSICAALEKNLREARLAGAVRLTYVNAWPFEDRGYNDLSDTAARAAVFDRALVRISAMQPDRLVIACNTLSILYPYAVFSRNAPVPVQGIVEAGVGLFADALNADPTSSIVLLGTKTTIESGVHRDSLVRRGVDPVRIATVSCHGLAGAIEKNVDGPVASSLLDVCASKAAEAAPPGPLWYAGLCCTHYAYVAARLVETLARKSGRRVRTLDPSLRLVSSLMSGARMLVGRVDGEGAAGGHRADTARGEIVVEVISKVELGESARRGIAQLVEPVSPATARALLSYSCVPDLF
jgi:glutamate racemase